jgi:hypothetical protein
MLPENNTFSCSWSQICTTSYTLKISSHVTPLSNQKRKKKRWVTWDMKKQLKVSEPSIKIKPQHDAYWWCNPKGSRHIYTTAAGNTLNAPKSVYFTISGACSDTLKEFYRLTAFTFWTDLKASNTENYTGPVILTTALVTFFKAEHIIQKYYFTP